MKRRFIQSFALFGLLLISPVLAVAKHIIGGEITYVCLGDGVVAGTKKYRFTMHIYRDAKPGTGGAPLDAVAPIAIYSGSNGSGLSLVKSFGQQLKSNELVPVDLSSPCLTAPPDVRVEEGIYEWEDELPVIAQSYHIVYQRCCRNVTINNILNPEDVGASYSVEITPLAQQLCNNGPSFKLFPPVVICANVPLLFDHSAIDIDGDILKYKFCTPEIGGGPILDSPGNIGCGGATPTPPCPPPFGLVQFVAPFSQNNPMGGSPQVSINSVSGMITGKPTTLGQFVVGVCVEEFRNGQLIGELRRDFQFNVVDCEAKVVADIEEDSITSTNVRKVISCGSTSVFIKNESSVKANIDNWYWLFDKKGVIDSLPGDKSDFNKNWDVTVVFPDTGDYRGILILNPGQPCSDTAEIIVKIRPDIRADFAFTQDSCVEGLTCFFDQSTSNAPFQYWTWTFGDGQISGSDSAQICHTYSDMIGHDVQLQVVDTSGCVDIITVNIPFLDLPKIAAFDYSPKELSSFKKTVDFTDLSLNPAKWRWVFDKYGGSNIANPTFEFPDTGKVKVGLFITDEKGCLDSVFVLLDIVPKVIWNMPNAFSPNDDGKNDSFFGKGFLDGATAFNMSIWNRWGEKIFETANPDTGWNGRKNNTGHVVPNGVYVCLVTFNGPRGEPYEYKGYATVVR